MTNVCGVEPIELFPGVPVIVPLLASKESPEGNDGVTSQIYGGVPPVPFIVAL